MITSCVLGTYPVLTSFAVTFFFGLSLVIVVGLQSILSFLCYFLPV